MPEHDSSEVWKPIEGYPGYTVSNLGRVCGPRKGLMKTACNDAGYPCVRLTKADGKSRIYRVHRLVAAAFIGTIPPGIEINHKNGIRHDPRAGNLEFATRQENVTHSIEVLGNIQRPPLHIGEDAHFSKLTAEKVRQIRQLRGKESYAALSQKFGVSVPTIYKIWNRESWQHIT